MADSMLVSVRLNEGDSGVLEDLMDRLDMNQSQAIRYLLRDWYVRQDFDMQRALEDVLDEARSVRFDLPEVEQRLRELIMFNGDQFKQLADGLARLVDRMPSSMQKNSEQPLPAYSVWARQQPIVPGESNEGRQKRLKNDYLNLGGII